MKVSEPLAGNERDATFPSVLGPPEATRPLLCGCVRCCPRLVVVGWSGLAPCVRCVDSFACPYLVLAALRVRAHVVCASGSAKWVDVFGGKLPQEDDLHRRERTLSMT